MANGCRRVASIRFVLALLLGAGALVSATFWLAQKKYIQYRYDVFASAEELAYSIPFEEMAAAVRADLREGSPVFRRLCDQLRDVVGVTPFRDIYCVGNRDGKLVLGPSSNKESASNGGTAGISAMGLLAEEVRQVYDSGRPCMVWPRLVWGNDAAYVAVPVIAPRTSEVAFAVIAVMDGREWRLGFLRLWFGPFLFTFALLAAVLVGFGLLKWLPRSPRFKQGHVGQSEVLVVICVGIAFTGILTWIVNDVEKRARHGHFLACARMQSMALSDMLRTLVQRIDRVAYRLAEERDVSKSSFERAVGSSALCAGPFDWLWVEAVPAAQLASAVKRVRDATEANTGVWEVSESGGRQDVLARMRYAPVIYAMAAEGKSALLGFDLYSDPDVRRTLEAASTGVASCLMPAVDSSRYPQQQTVLVVSAVGARGQGRGGGEGQRYLAAAFRPKRLLEQMLVLRVGGESGSFLAEMYRLNGGREFLASTREDQRPRSSLAVDGFRRKAFSLEASAPVLEFGQAFAVVIKATPVYFRDHPLWLFKVTCIAGLLLTLLLTGLVGFLTKRRVALEDQISARTFELERVSQQLTAILDAAADGVLGLDRDGKCVVVNASAAEMLGYDICEMVGSSSVDVWHRDSSDSEARTLEECPIYTTYKYGTQYRKPDAVFWRKDGSAFHVAFVSKPIYQQGALVGAVVSFHDITAQREADLALREACRKVERVNRELQEAGQIKGQFLAHMSHEIRTPLNCIIGMTGLMLNTRLDEEQYEFAETIRVSGEGLLDIVNEILDFSKIEAMRMELERLPFDLRHCVEDAVDLVAPSAAKKKLELTYLLDESLHNWWIGDATRIRQILVNLLNNAVKFTDQGEVDLTVSGHPSEGGAYLVTFSVRDTGVGITSERLGRLFQPFSQGDSSVSRRFGGTGLGLAISKKLCELMGGAMSVESTGISGQGSTFRCAIPLTPDYSLRSVIAKAESVSTIVGKRALLVERNQTSRDTLVQQLKSFGVTCVAVESAEQALQELGSLDLFGAPAVFDVAILDMQVSLADAKPLGAAIRALPSRDSLPIILLSPLGAHVESEAALDNVTHVTKPVKLSLLYEALLRVLTSRQATHRITPACRNAYDGEIGKRHALRILLAEDNIVNQKVALRMLSKIGYRADVVSNGAEALEAVRLTPYDVVLMDVQMPEMDGEEASVRIRREIPAEKQPWIVAMTANAMNGDRERYQAAGMNDYIPKPVRVERLIEVLLAVKTLGQKTGLAALPD